MLKAALRSLLARKVRLILTVLSIVLGVGSMAGTYVLTDTITRAFNGLVEIGTAPVDVLVRSSNAFAAMTTGGAEERKPVPESVLADVRVVPGVADAVGDVIGYAQIIDPATGDVIGTMGPPTAASSWNDVNGFVLRAGSPPNGADQVVLDASTAERYGIEVGERVRILFQGSRGEFEVVGTAGYGEAGSLFGATWALFDLPTAQRVLGREGELDTISVVAEEGVLGIELRERIARVLPKGIEAVTSATVASEQKEQISQALGYVRTMLLVFAFVALFVGAFIIFNTFVIIVAQRTRELALLRALGASRRQVMTSVVVEALVVGVVSSMIGVLFGIGIAIALKAVLPSVGLDIPASAGTVIMARTFVVSVIVGTVVTVVAAILPARRAARVAPVEALREAQDRPGRSLRFRLTSGAVVLAAGVAALLYGLFAMPSNALRFVGFGVAFTFIGVAMLAPLIARPVAAVIGIPIRAAGISGRLGRENSMRNPRRTAATASALMIGLGLVVFVAVFVTSAKASIDATLGATLKADFILTSPTLSGFSTSAADEAREVPGVSAVFRLRTGQARIGGELTMVDGIDPQTLPDVADIGIVQGSLSRLTLPNTIMVLEGLADEHGWALGDQVEVEFPATGNVSLRMVAIFSNPGLVDAYAVSLDTFEDNVAQQLDVEVLVKVDEGADVGAVQSSLEKALRAYPNVEVQDQAAFREMYSGFLDQMLNMLTALLLLAVIIAVFGVVNTLSLSIYERTRELGLLRAVGLTRRQTRSMVRWEAVIISVMGALLGVVIGIAFGWALQRALAPQGFSAFAIPGTRLAVYVLLAGLAGVVAAIFPARRAARLDVLEAIAYE
ncbi:MAG: FtsX-like permease family protein [Actinomycetota bacterium]